MSKLSGSRPLPARLGAIGLVALAIAGCTTAAPISLVLPSGDVLRGGSATRVNGQFFVKNERLNCYGSYERTVVGYGLSPGRTTTVTASCSDGTRATSQSPFWDTGEAELTFNDGRRGRIILGEGAKE